jgi:hypothetical protein
MSNVASDLSITFDLLPHPIHAASVHVRWLLLGATRFRTFLDCSIAQLRDVLVHKVIQQLALVAAALTLSRAQADACALNGFVGDSVDPQHIKITFEGILLRDDVILQVASSLTLSAHRFCLLSARFFPRRYAKNPHSRNKDFFPSLCCHNFLTHSTSTGAS